MKNSIINRGVVKKIANALGDINNRAVYVGGAIVSMYADDPAADDVRPTKDLDITLEIASFSDLANLQEELSKKGFNPHPEENVICRFKYEDVLVDVMATEQIGWAPSNEWFKPGFAALQSLNVDGIEIRILPLSYFLATKFSAFHGRAIDPRTSHDFEDIAYILDNRLNLVEEILNSPEDVRTFLQGEFHQILTQRDLQEAVLGNLYYETQSKRFEMMTAKLKKITGSH